MNIFINSNVSQHEEISICDCNGDMFGLVPFSPKPRIKSFNDLQQYVNNLNFNHFYEYPLKLEKTIYIDVSFGIDRTKLGWVDVSGEETVGMSCRMHDFPMLVVVRDRVSSLREVLDRMPASGRQRRLAESCDDYKNKMDYPAFFYVKGSLGWVEFAWKKYIFVDRNLHRIIVAPEPCNGKIKQRNTGKTPKILRDFFNPVNVKIK